VEDKNDLITIKIPFMKLRTVLIAGALLIACLAFRQKPQKPKEGRNMGLYMSTEDFTHGKLSYTAGSSGAPASIKIRDGLFGSARVVLLYDGKKQVLPVDRVYGYRDARGHDYRYFDRRAYRILDTAGFYLYDATKMVQGLKIARPQTSYYFSVKGDAAVEPLTLVNLEAAFAANANFRYRLEAMQGPFGGDRSLAAWDEALKTYKIKVQYGLSR
jgi:hypothetical protein